MIEVYKWRKMLCEIILTTILGVFLYLLFRILPSYRLWSMSLNFPGPKAFPLLGNIHNFNIIGTQATQDWEYSMRKYGTTFRYWIGTELHIFVSEPDDMQVLLSNTSLLTKSTPYKLLESWLGTGLLISSGKLWHSRRRALTPTFHLKILSEFVPIFNKCAKTLVNCLRDEDGKPPFSITQYLSRCALDAIAETAMGTEIKAQTNPSHKYPQAVTGMTKLMIEKMCNPLLTIEPIYSLSGQKKMESENLKILFDLPEKMVKKKTNRIVSESENRANPEESEVPRARKKTAFLELLIQNRKNHSQTFNSDKDLKDEVITFMFAGHDTTTMALSYSVWLLGLHPDVQEELFQEISKVGKKDPKQEDLQRLTFLDHVLKESLRLYSPVPTIGRLATEDITLPSCGLVIPKGSQVDMYLYAMHRNEKFFPDPEKFNPERFSNNLRPYSYLPFSGGQRNCIGQKFAMLELKSVLYHLVYNYVIVSEPELILNPEMLLRSEKGPDIRIRSRNN